MLLLLGAACMGEEQQIPIIYDATLCDQVCQGPVAGQLFSPVSSTNKTNCHDITEMLLKVALNTITLTQFYSLWFDTIEA